MDQKNILHIFVYQIIITANFFMSKFFLNLILLRSYEISDKGLKKFSTIVSKNLRQLEQLSLKFEKYLFIFKNNQNFQ